MCVRALQMRKKMLKEKERDTATSTRFNIVIVFLTRDNYDHQSDYGFGEPRANHYFHIEDSYSQPVINTAVNAADNIVSLFFICVETQYATTRYFRRI